MQTYQRFRCVLTQTSLLSSIDVPTNQYVYRVLKKSMNWWKTYLSLATVKKNSQCFDILPESKWETREGGFSSETIWRPQLKSTRPACLRFQEPPGTAPSTPVNYKHYYANHVPIREIVKYSNNWGSKWQDFMAYLHCWI